MGITLGIEIHITSNIRCCNGITISIHMFGCKIGIKF